MVVPAWTAREWGPLARELCAHVLDTNGPVSDHHDTSRRDENKRHQKLLLRCDRLVAKMYSHRYMEITPQQIKGEVEEIATKMEIHLLGERASRLRQLASGCDYRVVKLLLELANAPTQASDSRVTVDSAAPLEALQAWNRLLTPSKDAQKAEAKAQQEKALAASMEAELLQVAWDDDWWKERQDDDASELDDAMDIDSEDLDGMSSDDGEYRSVGGIASRVLAEQQSHMWDGEEMHTTDKEEDVQAIVSPLDGEEEGDDLLLKYFRRATDPAKPMEVEDAREQIPRDQEQGDIFFSFDAPSRLLPLVQSLNQSRVNSLSSTTSLSREPRQVVHERILVEAVMYVLRGVPSPFFDTRPSPLLFFGGELSTSDFITTTLVSRGIAVSHLSPSTMIVVLEKVASAASNLQFLREVSAFLANSAVEGTRSSAAEGMACELNVLLNTCELYINDVHELMAKTSKYDTSSTATVLPTLLSATGKLQEMFAMLSWLKATVAKCIEPFQTHSRQDINAAELSSILLSALYRELELKFLESSGSLLVDEAYESLKWDSYEILCRLFSRALSPYLDVMDRVLFDRGYDARIDLHHELFFVSSDRSFASPASPRSSALKLSEESFEDTMAGLMPFRIVTTAVPVFLLPLMRSLGTALESRQILNQYLNQNAHNTFMMAHPTRLSTQFMTAFTRLTSKSTPSTVGSVPLRTTPFSEVVRQSVIQPIAEKCASINGAIADLFRVKLLFRQHIDTLRLFLLMQQQDIFTDIVQFLIEQIQRDPVGWARNELVNTAFQDSIQRLHTEGLVSNEQRDIAARINIRVDTKELEKLRITRHIDIMAVRHLHFKFTASHPLRVLFSGSIIHKYSRLATLLLQVKLVELLLTNFKQTYRHRLCFLQTQEPLRRQLVYLADMLHYTRAVLNYLANQMTGDAWSKVERVIQHSKSIREINEAHEAYLDKMQNAFFVLKKHEGFTRQFMQNFNDIISYGSRVEGFVRTVERNMPRLFDTIEPNVKNKGGRNSTRRDVGTRRRDFVPNDEFRELYAKLQRSLKNPEGNYENQLHVITIVLDAMVKNGASPHVNELLLLLTFNNFRGSCRTRSSSSR